MSEVGKKWKLSLKSLEEIGSDWPIIFEDAFRRSGLCGIVLIYARELKIWEDVFDFMPVAEIPSQHCLLYAFLVPTWEGNGGALRADLCSGVPELCLSVIFEIFLQLWVNCDGVIRIYRAWTLVR